MKTSEKSILKQMWNKRKQNQTNLKHSKPKQNKFDAKQNKKEAKQSKWNKNVQQNETKLKQNKVKHVKQVKESACKNLQNKSSFA